MKTRSSLSLPLLLLLFLFLSLPSSSFATNNITAILASHPDFSSFSSLCTQTGVASQIYARRTVTVLAVPNSILTPLLQPSTFSASTLYDVISYHVLLDYFDIAKFQTILNHTALSATLLQTSGQVTGNQGYVNITVRGSAVHLGRAGSGLLTSTVVSEIYKSPYNISVVGISNALLPAGVVSGAPEPAPAPVNFTSILIQGKIYSTFLSLIKSTGVDLLLLKHDTLPGVTIFAPDDGAFKKLPAGVFGNLTTAEQVALLEFHCLPSFFSAPELATLATPQMTLASGSGGGTYEYASITSIKGGTTVVNTGFNKVPVGPTLYSQEPLGLYGIPTILMPTDLFGAPPAAAPSPAPAMSPTPTPSVSPAPAPSSPTPAGAPEPAVPSPPAPQSKSNSSSSSESSAAQCSALPLARGLMVTLLSCVVLVFTFS